MKSMVRTESKLVFEVDRNTLEAKCCAYYDAFCFSDPLPDVEYITFDDWDKMKEANQCAFKR